MVDRLPSWERFIAGPVVKLIETGDLDLYQQSATRNNANLTILAGSGEKIPQQTGPGEEITLYKPGTGIEFREPSVPEGCLLAVVTPSEGRTLREFWIAVDGARAVTSRQETF